MTMQPKTKEQAIEQEIRNDQAKMLLEDSFVVARHNGIEYRLINERVVKEAMEAYAQSQSDNEWISVKGKELPRFEEQCIVVTATLIKDYYDVNVWTINKVDSPDGWYWGLMCGDGEEWGNQDELRADYYKVMKFPTLNP